MLPKAEQYQLSQMGQLNVGQTEEEMRVMTLTE
jgi:hypothetical protein